MSNDMGGSTSKNSDTSLVTAMTKHTLSDKILHNQKSPLLKLPAELRNQIYRYIFYGHVASLPLTHLKELSLRSREADRNFIPIPQLVHLARVCRQIHHETYLLPFELLELRIDGAFATQVPATQAWLDSLSDDRCAAISKLNIPVDFSKAYIPTSIWNRPILRVIDVHATPCTAIKRHATKLRAILSCLKGLKHMTVRPYAYATFRATEEQVAKRMEAITQECESIGEWMQSLFEGREIEVVVADT